MKTLTAIIAIGLSAGLAAPAAAETTSAGFEIVERNDRGQVTRVSKDGQTYAVCMNDQQDSCINPREAGLNWGNVPLAHWPGRPASEGGN